MLIPYNTDAPIYYFPYATIGLIVVNVVVFLGTMSLTYSEPEVVVGEDGEIQVIEAEPSPIEWFLLQYDQINPIQWITSNFLHADILHVVGNMIFLWGFGLIIEGKLGWLRFLALYLFLGVVTCAFEQTLFFFLVGEGASLGASSIIFGLLAIAMVWAPKNEFTCLLFLRFIPRNVELPVVVFAAIKIGFEIFYLVIGGLQISSALLHMFGVVVAIPLAYLYVRWKWVDCEGWDAMTVYFSSAEKQEKVRTEFRDRNKVADLKEKKEERNQQQKQIQQSLTSALQAKQTHAALAIFRKFESELQSGEKLPAKLLLPLISAMHEKKEWDDSIPLLVKLLKKLPPEKAVKIRLKLAQILIQISDQPKQGVAVLRKLPKQLPEKEHRLRAKLAKLAKVALAEGSLEVEVHDW